LGGGYELNEGIFNLTTQEKGNLNLQENELELIKPLYTSAEVKKFYTSQHNNYWVIYTDSSFKDKSKIENFPNLKNHIDRFKEIITTDNKPYGIHRTRKEYFFKGTKILSLRKCVGRPLFSYTDFDSYVNQAFYVIKSERINLKYLTALLNSKLVAFWLKYKGKMQGDNYQVDKEPILNIPIKNIENTKAFEILVDYIRFTKSLRNSINEYVTNEHISNSFEEIIDGMIFELYFSDEFKDKNLAFINYIERYFKEIYNLTEKEKIIQINEVYSKIKESNNEIRNNLILIDTKLKSIMIEIKKV
jgi:hypothetical protein